MREEDDRPIGRTNPVLASERRSIPWIWEGVVGKCNVINWRRRDRGVSYWKTISCATNVPEGKWSVRKSQKNRGFLTPLVVTLFIFRPLQSPQARIRCNRLRINDLLLRFASSS
jgi:hypothetical protein